MLTPPRSASPSIRRPSRRALPPSPAEPDAWPGGQADVAVFGAGIVGLATARELLVRHPGLDVRVLDKEPVVAAHQTGHNSGVLHAGLYYPPGSLKAELCRTGKERLERFAQEKGIPFRLCGKLVVAVAEDELGRFEALRQRAEANGIPGLEVLGPAGLRDIEPQAAGLRALWSPTTGIIDFTQVARALAVEVEDRGGHVHLGTEVNGITAEAGGRRLSTDRGDLRARGVVACAGLQSDRVAALTGDRPDLRILPFRGDYYTLSAPAAALVNGLIYPVPDERFPFLGIHLTRRIDGQVWAGPNAVLAFAREGYRRRDIDLGELAAILSGRPFRRLARRYWRTGLLELGRDWSKAAFVRAVRRYLPALGGRDLTFGPAGVRAQAVDGDGNLVDDFRLEGRPGLLHVA